MSEKVSEIQKWMKEKFQAQWDKCLKMPRGNVIKTTRKYVAQLFFYAGMSAMAERTVDRQDLEPILSRLKSLETEIPEAGSARDELQKIAEDLKELLTLQVARMSE